MQYASLIISVAAVLTLVASPTRAETYTVLHSIPYSFAGVTPVGSTLYGTTWPGGGSIYSMNMDGSNFQIVHNFTIGNGGYFPYGGLTVVGSKLYGTTVGGGVNDDGTVFSMDLNGTNFQTLHAFSLSDGSRSESHLTYFESTLYGTTTWGGAYGSGTVFSINLDGSNFQSLYSLGTDITDGAAAYSGLTRVGTTLYGTAYSGGDNGIGSVYSINLDGSGFQTLHSFTGGSDGVQPFAGVTLVGSKLYGTTAGDTVFSMNLDGSDFQVVYHFTGDDNGSFPYGGLTLVGSRLYGTTYYTDSASNGAVFSMNLDGSDYHVIHRFQDGLDGRNPTASLTLVGNTLYGTTLDTVFAITVPEPSTLVLGGMSLFAILFCALKRLRESDLGER